MVKGVNLLYHEATYDETMADKAAKYYHSTAAQAATTAREAGVGRLLIGHYSSRYDSEQPLLDEARLIFPQSFLTHENDIFTL
jgi:ribonuclease Z